MRIASVLVFAIGLAPVTVLAEGGRIRVSAALEYIDSHADIEDKESGEKTRIDSSFFRQLYNVELQKEIFPYLNFRTGGLFRLNDRTTIRRTEAEGKEETDFEERLGRLFAELHLDNPLYNAGATYSWSESEEGVANKLKTTREEINSIFRWRPVGLPLLDLEYNRLRAYTDPSSRDVLTQVFRLLSRYEYEGFSYDYRYTRNDQNETIEDFGTLSQIHDGGMRYSDSFFADRLRVTGGFRLTHSTLEPTGTGDVKLPTTSAGTAFYSLDDDAAPIVYEDSPPNPLSNIVIGTTGIGLPPAPVSVGLDFTFPTTVDTLYILPTTSPGEIDSVADDFTWIVSSSDDQLIWTEHDTDAIYNRFDNRWEISFSPDAEPRYLKVRTQPLNNTPVEIRVLDIQAFTTIAATRGLEIVDDVQNYNLGLRWAITDRTTTAYNGFYRRQENQPFDLIKTTLTNSLSLEHVFSPMFVANARLLRADGTETRRGDVTDHTYTASLSAHYLDTLSQTLVYSGTYNRDENGSGTRDSILLRTNADLYREWSMILDVGYLRKDPILGAAGTNTLLRLSTNLIPNPKLQFTMDYSGSWRTETGDSTRLDQNARFQAFWVPLRTLSLFARIDFRKHGSTGESLQVGQDYSVTWSPFPDGALNFTLAYNQTADTRNNKSRILSPGIRWRITPASLLTVRFNLGTIETESEISDVRNLRAEFKIFY
jgi:hypothetical protein